MTQHDRGAEEALKYFKRVLEEERLNDNINPSETIQKFSEIMMGGGYDRGMIVAYNSDSLDIIRTVWGDDIDPLTIFTGLMFYLLKNLKTQERDQIIKRIENYLGGKDE